MCHRANYKSLILLGGGSHGGGGRSATNICPAAFSHFPSLAARKHTVMHTTPLWTARLSFITSAGEPNGRLKINVTERRRPDSQPAGARRSEEDRGFKRSQAWKVETINIKNICTYPELLFLSCPFQCHTITSYKHKMSKKNSVAQCSRKRLRYLRPRIISRLLDCLEAVSFIVYLSNYSFIFSISWV